MTTPTIETIPDIRAAVLKAPEQFGTQRLRRPEAGPGEVLVRVSFTGICGSDFPIVSGTHPRATLPLVMGHEITGTIENPGDSGLTEGATVAVNPLLPCDTCGACRKELWHVCRNLRLLGIDTPGSMAELIAVPAANVIPFSENVPAKEAALAEPLAVAVHAIRRARLAAGERVLIFGAGPIGILVALAARHAGAADVAVVEPSERRREVVEALGLRALGPSDVPVAKEHGETATDVVFDCAGHHSVTPLLTKVAPVRGRIVIVAVHHGSAEVDLRELAFAEQEIIGVRVYESADFAESVRLISHHELPLAGIPISEYPLESVEEAFAEARSGTGAVKILVRSLPQPLH
ncbi:2-desacetyl-2-hydroxyethyl bacteriochlorophyllide A dehydrogenase [Pseudarthrobacter sp. PvP004]|uniref:Alcohol dehydrogenase n=1 Tax=Paenarthrobacter aurescens (strain TC1) TaxID=290340 RepID=A1RAL2_PAEAT|nr:MULTISPECIES: alcohol dehydrogenase catalytic domain-containing protein [Micrococcaceae]ABM10037.1 putative alcohol dehydrogenase [Paenarthrobacter aurescens TC1]MBP2268894.1 2-desacetyl-2-hydroxyethyl bacteriochlorophyllide A dehydrogenase [Pseudarthrobacter sp. PvP004]